MLNESNFRAVWVFFCVFLCSGLVNNSTYASESLLSDKGKEVGALSLSNFEHSCVSGYVTSQESYYTGAGEVVLRLTYDTTGFKSGLLNGKTIELRYPSSSLVDEEKKLQANIQRELLRTAQTERLPVQIKSDNPNGCKLPSDYNHLNYLVNVCSNETECNK